MILGFVVLAGVIFMLSGGTSTSTSENTVFSEDAAKTEVEQLVKDYFQASYTIDYKTWTGEEELQYTTPKFQEKLKMIFPEYRKSFNERQMVQQFESIEIEDISFESANIGTVICTVTGSGTDNGEAFTTSIKYKVDIQTFHDKWVIDNYYPEAN